MVRRSYYLPAEAVASLDRAVAEVRHLAYVDRDLDKSEVVAALIGIGLDHLPLVVEQLRAAQRAVSAHEPRGSSTR